MEEQMVNDQFYDHASLGGGILTLEHHLIDVSSVSNLSQGIFYTIPIQVGHNVFIKQKNVLKTFNTLPKCCKTNPMSLYAIKQYFTIISILRVPTTLVYSK